MDVGHQMVCEEISYALHVIYCKIHRDYRRHRFIIGIGLTGAAAVVWVLSEAATGCDCRMRELQGPPQAPPP